MFSRTTVWTSRIANWTLTIALVSAMAIGVYYLANTRSNAQNPRVLQSYYIEPPTEALGSGEWFHVHVLTMINKQCPYEIRWVLTDKVTNEAVVYVVEPIRESAPLGLQKVMHDHFIPAHVKPGDYWYISQIFDFCPGAGRAALSTQKPIPITVR